MGVESDFEKKLFVWSFLDYNFDVVQPLAKLPGEFVENPGDFFSDSVVIHR